MRHVAFVSLTLLQVAAGLSRQSPLAYAGNAARNGSGKSAEPIWQFLKNEGDVQYTTNMTIGGQSFQALIDTGSFEILVFSRHCKVCGDSENLYNDESSGSYERGIVHTDHGFGSGTTWSISAFENVNIGALHASHQLFWEVYDADMPLLQEGSPFQLLVGVGPPQSAVKMAIEATESVKQEVLQRKASGSTATTEGEDQQIVAQYEMTAELAKNATSFLGNLDMEVFSFCFLKQSGFGGYMVMHDKDPEEPTRASMFTKIPVVGDLYWSAEMRDVQLSKGGHAETATVLGCDKGACSAVIDTGTSLIVAPQEAVDMVAKAVDSWLEKTGGNCSDLSVFPSFEFKLNGTLFSLPPEAYIGEAPSLENVPSGISVMTSHWNDRKAGSSCVPLIMASDMDTQFGPLWILGMPFFRKYYSTFKLSSSPAGSASLQQPWMPSMEARSMHFSEADEDCRPNAPANSGNNLVRQADGSRELSKLRVDLNNLRAPAWATKAAGNPARRTIRI